jgi:cell filamentation protein
VNRYSSSDDPYCYPGTDVLRNKFDIRDPDKLADIERRIGYSRSLQDPPNGKFGRAHLMAHHRQLFGDVYPWAGKPRTIGIAKGVYRFEPPERITKELDRVLGNIAREKHLKELAHATFCNRAAEHFSDLNVIHPFRDGNGRTLRRFFEQLAERAGYRLDWSKVPPELMIEASRKGWEHDLGPMRELFQQVTREH